MPKPSIWKWNYAEYLPAERADFILWNFQNCMELPGDVAEFGSFRGETARELCKYAQALNLDKTVHIFESFMGLMSDQWTEHDQSYVGMKEFHRQGSMEAMNKNLEGFTNYQIHKGLFSEYLDCNPLSNLCFALIDCDLYKSCIDAIKLCADKIVPGGCIAFDDYGTWTGITKAVDDTFKIRIHDEFDKKIGITEDNHLGRIFDLTIGHGCIIAKKKT